MKIGLVIHSNGPETVWNAFRFGNFSLKQGDTVKIFLLGKGVEAESLDNNAFKITEQMALFVEGGGIIMACGTCLKIRKSQGSDLCPLSTIKDLYDLVHESDKILTF